MSQYNLSKFTRTMHNVCANACRIAALHANYTRDVIIAWLTTSHLNASRAASLVSQSLSDPGVVGGLTRSPTFLLRDCRAKRRGGGGSARNRRGGCKRDGQFARRLCAAIKSQAEYAGIGDGRKRLLTKVERRVALPAHYRETVCSILNLSKVWNIKL